MLTNVPQYIDVEDKVAGPLTAKQLFWLIGLAAILFILWSFIPAKGVFFVIALPVFLLFIALAFYRPFGQPLIGFVLHGVSFMFAPKVYVWRRMPQGKELAKRTQQQKSEDIVIRDKSLTPTQLSALAHVLDTEGAAHDEEAVALIRQTEIRNAPKQRNSLFGNAGNKSEQQTTSNRINTEENNAGRKNEQAGQNVQHRNFGDFLEM